MLTVSVLIYQSRDLFRKVLSVRTGYLQNDVVCPIKCLALYTFSSLYFCSSVRAYLMHWRIFLGWDYFLIILKKIILRLAVLAAL